MRKYALKDYASRGVLCRLTKDQFHYLLDFSERHKISISAAMQRMVRIVRTLESMPEVRIEDDEALRQAAMIERQKGGV